jgi:hypothetical protein
MTAYRRLTDNDRRLGPITIGERDKRNRPLSIGIQSGDEEHTGCSLMLRGFGWPLRVALPQIIKPWREWRVVKNPDAYWAARGGGYWNVWRREYSLYLNEGALHIHYGPQTHDSITTKSKCYFLPWKQWRNIRHSMYGIQGEHFWTEAPKPRRNWDDWHKAREQCPVARFVIEDYDGARIVASTRIEEREYRIGDSWCSWLGYLRRPRLFRSLMIDFAAEVGPDKGSWKGGMMGHSIDMLPGELHEAAFRRYCEQEVSSKNGRSRIQFIGVA